MVHLRPSFVTIRQVLRNSSFQVKIYLLEAKKGSKNNYFPYKWSILIHMHKWNSKIREILFQYLHYFLFLHKHFVLINITCEFATSYFHVASSKLADWCSLVHNSVLKIIENWQSCMHSKLGKFVYILYTNV